MAEYKLHCMGESGNAFKIASYLDCAGLDWEPVFVDYFNGQTRDADWRAGVNAMGEVPVLEHGGEKLVQSGAILMQLADETGKFAPEGNENKREVLRWILFDNHKFTGHFAVYRFLKALAPQPADPAVLAFFKGRVDGNFSIVEEHLANQPFIVGDKPTIADFSLSGYVFYPTEEHGYDFATSHPNIHGWKERLRALPGWRSPYDSMPRHA